jgi:hypothetical protein
MEFELHIDMDNDEFQNNRERVIARMLREVAVRFERGFVDGKIMDANGNSVGNFEMRHKE